MRPNKVRQFWQEKKPLAVGWLGTPDTYVVETMANSGFDALVLDMQHGMAIGPDRAALALQTMATTDVTPLVRVPWNDPVIIGKTLDLGTITVAAPPAGPGPPSPGPGSPPPGSRSPLLSDRL